MSHYTHLSITDRRRLYVFLEMKLSMVEIARRLSKSRATLYREIKRNQESEGYFPVLAHEKANARAKRVRFGKLNRNGHLRAYVTQGLQKGWSPEQISGRMKYQRLQDYVCTETIYRYIYQSSDEKLYQYLPSQRVKRRKRHSRKPHHCRYGDIRLITQRPQEVETSEHFGHWEGDTIEFCGTKEKAVTTLVERKSRVVLLIKNTRRGRKAAMKI